MSGPCTCSALATNVIRSSSAIGGRASSNRLPTPRAHESVCVSVSESVYVCVHARVSVRVCIRMSVGPQLCVRVPYVERNSSRCGRGRACWPKRLGHVTDCRRCPCSRCRCCRCCCAGRRPGAEGAQHGHQVLPTRRSRRYSRSIVAATCMDPISHSHTDREADPLCAVKRTLVADSDSRKMDTGTAEAASGGSRQ
jgi:hypothetical protein